ncbi:MAG: hypothetical protein LBB34_04740 [Holosporales bacterium]|nr:hypothetical protein [Holosporales bacterium]
MRVFDFFFGNRNISPARTTIKIREINEVTSWNSPQYISVIFWGKLLHSSLFVTLNIAGINRKIAEIAPYFLCAFVGFVKIFVISNSNAHVLVPTIPTMIATIVSQNKNMKPTILIEKKRKLITASLTPRPTIESKEKSIIAIENKVNITSPRQ